MTYLELGLGLVLLVLYVAWLRKKLKQREREAEKRELIQRINAGIYYDHIYGDDHEY